MSEREAAAGELRQSADRLRSLHQSPGSAAEREQAQNEHARACARYSRISDGVRR